MPGQDRAEWHQDGSRSERYGSIGYRDPEAVLPRPEADQRAGVSRARTVLPGREQPGHGRDLATAAPGVHVGMKQILCYGDSNTWGADPADDSQRFEWPVRWPGVLQRELGGEDFHVVEDGLGGRTTVYDDPLLAAPERQGAHRSGARVPRPARPGRPDAGDQRHQLRAHLGGGGRRRGRRARSPRPALRAGAGRAPRRRSCSSARRPSGPSRTTGARSCGRGRT